MSSNYRPVRKATAREQELENELKALKDSKSSGNVDQNKENRKFLYIIGLLIAGGFFLFAGDHVVDEYYEGDCSKSEERIVYNNHDYKCMGRIEHNAVVVPEGEVKPLKK